MKEATCKWCGIAVVYGARYCSATHKTRAKAKVRAISAASAACVMPNSHRYLSQTAALAAGGGTPYHCRCLGWHMTNPCPTPNKVRYLSTSHAHRAQPGSKNAGMRCYLCLCGSYHWGHTEKARTTLGRVLAEGSAASRRAP